MCVQYIGGCSVHRGDTMSTSGGYHEYIGGCSVHRRDIMIHVEEQLDKILSISIENSDVLNIPRCTEHTLYRVIFQLLRPLDISKLAKRESLYNFICKQKQLR